MVTFKFCPQCAAIDMQQTPDGLDYCPKCKYSGTALEGAMDKVNAYKTKLKGGPVPTAPRTGSRPSNPLIGFTDAKDKTTSGTPLSKRPAKKQTDDFEIW